MLNWFRKSAEIERRDATLAAPDDWMMSLWAGSIPGSLAVSGQSALKVPAVAAAVRVISEAAATLDVQVRRLGNDGKETADPDHPVARMLRDDVNDWTSAFELIRDLTADALTRDAGGFAFVNRVGGELREVVRYRPGVITVEYDVVTAEPVYRINGVVTNAANILHVRGPFDRCPLSLAANAIGAASLMETHVGKLFQNAARPGGVIEIPKGLGDEGLKKMRAAWRAAMEGADNAGKTALLWDGATFRPTTMISTDAQFLENRQFQILEIARAFRVPPSMMYELERATWSNSEQMGREFLTYSLEPWLRTLESALRRALFLPAERRRYRIVFDRDDLTRADLGARATAYSSLIASRVLNPNEAREWEGLSPYAAGDAFSNPNITTDHNSGPTSGEGE